MATTSEAGGMVETAVPTLIPTNAPAAPENIMPVKMRRLPKHITGIICSKKSSSLTFTPDS